MTRLAGLVDVEALVRELRAEQLLREPIDLRPAPVALRALEHALLLDAIEGRVSPEIAKLVSPDDFATNGFPALWAFVVGAIDAGALPTPETIAAGLAAHVGADPDVVLEVVGRIASGAAVFTPNAREKAERIAKVARLRRVLSAVERIDIESRVLVHVRGDLDVDAALAELREAIREAWKA